MIDSMKLLNLIGCCFLLMQSQSVFAGKSNPYIELDYVRSTISIAGTEFKPYHPKFKAGYYFRDKIALELQYADSGEETVGASFLELEQMYGYFLRLDSDVQNRVRIYVLAGRAHTTVNTGAESIKLKDIAYGIGAEEQLQSYQNAYFTVEYGKFLSADGVDLKSLSLGIRFDF